MYHNINKKKKVKRFSQAYKESTQYHVLIFPNLVSSMILHITFGKKHESSVSVVLISFLRNLRIPIRRSRWSNTWKSWILRPNIFLSSMFTHFEIFAAYLSRNLIDFKKAHNYLLSNDVNVSMHEASSICYHVTLNATPFLSSCPVNLIEFYMCPLSSLQYSTVSPSHCHIHFSQYA